MEFGFKSLYFETITTDFQLFKLLNPVDYVSKSGVTYRIPRGAASDLASIPKALFGAPLYLIPNGWYAPAAYGHDSAFRNTLLIVNDDMTTTLANLTEQQSNDLLLEMMQSLKPNPTMFEKAQMDAIFDGVVNFGFRAYNDDRDGEASWFFKSASD